MRDKLTARNSRKKSSNAHSLPKNKYWKTIHVTNTQYHVTWKVFPYTKDSSRIKCIVNNNVHNINALNTLVSLNTLKIGSRCITTDSQPSSIAHSTICIQLFRGKMRSDWFHDVEILQVRGQHGEVEYWHPSGLEETIYKWDIQYMS